MPEPATPPPEVTPQTPEPPPVDLTAPRQYKPINPEQDADHQLRQMISRRRKPATPPEDVTAPVAGAPPVVAPSAEPKEEPKEDVPAAGFNDAIASVLRFKPAPKKKEDEKKDPPKAPVQAALEPPAPPKTIVKKKAKEQQVVPPDITEITAAATTAAVRALQPSLNVEKATAKPEDALTPQDRHDYEVAKTLAETNPKYKDAPRILLDQIKKSESYAARWENQNPGKQFNPDDEEHNDFYDTIERPWSDHEFRTAESEMVAERIAAKTTRQYEAKIKALEQDSARLELTPLVSQTLINAATYMAKELKVIDNPKLSKGDFAGFAEDDPITAEAMGASLGPIQPLIETIVQLDDPKGRFPLNPKNQEHQEWLRLLADKEAKYAGVEHNGKKFATRAAYWEMTDAQRSRHWYLTPDNLVSEVVQDAIATAAERIKTEKERQKKIALSLGYVLPNAPAGAPPKTQATNGTQGHDNGSVNSGTQKPASPSVGSGAKIDSEGKPAPTGRSATMAAIGDILFRQGNAVP